MSNTTEKRRNLGIDILCCLGVMLLLGLSFFKVIGYAEAPVNSYMDALPLAARWFCLSGAMLLAACTGYVMSGRKFSASYFKIFIRLIYVYLLCGAMTTVIRYFVLHEEMNVRTIVQSFFDFTTSETGKFAGMYFALLLAAPFLNAAFHGLQNRRARQAFLVVAAMFSTLQPMLMFDGIYVIPEWCKGLFPVAAYIGGAYIKRYSKRRDIISLIIFLLSLCIAQTVVVLSVSMTKGMMYCPWLDSMASLPCLCIAMSLVGIFRSKHNGTGSGHRFFGGAAGGALAALLLGDPLLRCLLPALQERFPSLASRLWAGLVVVPVIFILGVAIGLILQAPLLLIRNAIRNHGMEESEEAEADEEADEIPEEAEEEETEAEEESDEGASEEPEEEPEFDEEAAAEAYEEDSIDEEEYEEEQIMQTISMPGRTYSQPLPQASATSSRHTITVPVSQPEMQVRLTQPPAEKPIGVHEVKLPEQRPQPKPVQPRNYTLDDILSEQGIAVKHMPESVDDLIAELTK